MTKVSVIVPVYNVELYLSECIASILNQDILSEEMEIILVNDGSTDKSAEIAVRIANENKNVQYYEQNNQGQAVARNLGLDVAEGEYILFVDSDDYLEPNVLSTMVSIAHKYNPDILITSMKVYNADGNFQILNDFTCYDRNYCGSEALLLGLNIGSACARLYKRSFMNEYHLRFTLGIKHEDVLLNLDAALYAGKIHSINLCSYVYRWNAGSTDRSFDDANVTKALLSDLEIARHEKRLSCEYSNNKAISSLFQNKANSLVVSVIFSLYTQNVKLLRQNKRNVIEYAKRHKLLPIKGETLSWKTTILAKLLNAFFMK